MIISIPSIILEGMDIQWRLYSDVILYAEKHVEEKIDRSYFRWEKVQQATSAYIPQLEEHLNEAGFNCASQGYVFRDCFVAQKGNEPYTLLISFEKNKRDERPIYCPACRTIHVQGNSYPILNVRSWECENPLCPDRSMYNRGKRFAFSSLFRQRQIEEPENKISSALISKWRLDCAKIESDEELFDMACLYYSCVGDTVVIFAKSESRTVPSKEYKRRNISVQKMELTSQSVLSEFKNGPFFHRYIYDNNYILNNDFKVKNLGNLVTLINCDAHKALSEMEAGSIDAAITSPPYYNAKAYSTWPNIYCYLYDMRNIAKEVFRTLKEGGVYLYNIFDYFDNENNIVFSAMGDKRMILGAYTIDLFLRLGFSLQGNIIWNKGEIQGNRSFNQGNETPYYQAPLNCWEHIFIFSKGAPKAKYKELRSEIKNIKPVMKIVKGKNILGHDAPFPKELPEILLSHMDSSEIVLDPFSGSMTTGMAAYERGIRSICIEKNEEYFHLSEKIFMEHHSRR